jgi:hypothetical protein
LAREFHYLQRTFEVGLPHNDLHLTGNLDAKPAGQRALHMSVYVMPFQSSHNQ